MGPVELCIELSLRAGTQHADREGPGPEELHEVGEQDTEQQAATQDEAAEQGHDREARTEGERLAAAVQQVLALQLRLVDIRIAVDDLIQGEQQEDDGLMQAVLSRAELNAEEEEAAEDRKERGQAAGAEVITEAVLRCPVRDMKRADAEVGDDEHLLSQGGKAETKNTALVVPGDPDDGKGEHDGGQRVEKTPDGVPQKILFLIVFVIHSFLFFVRPAPAGSTPACAPCSGLR